ncbi:MAG: PEP-CTERM sorting domain-containing protein [Pirellulales bacterium]|nr:PEP-CTERM sorting domain-containing protein [Pirellulales bacterium]
MKRLIIGFVAGVILATGTVAWGNPVIDVSVSTDHASYLPLETIEITVTATNPADDVIELYFPSAYQAGYKIDYFFDLPSYYAYAQVDTSVFIEAHESHTWTFDYDWDLLILPSGIHSLEGYVLGYAQSPSIEIEIISDPEPGDFDLDGDVDVSDLGILGTNYGTTVGATWRKGDTDGGGVVDVTDLGVLATHFGYGTNTANTVPEPSTMTLVCISILTLTLRRRKW